MASTRGKTQAQNLASLLLVKQKIAARNDDLNNAKLAPPPAGATGAHSDERLTYRQNPVVINPSETTTIAATSPPKETTEQPKLSRKTKQIEVELLDKKMEEINKKQEVKTNETLDTWKGFDSLNYGFTPEPGKIHSTPVPPPSSQQPEPLSKRQPSPVETAEQPANESPRQYTPVPQRPEKRQPVPKTVDSPIKHERQPRSLPDEEEPRKPTQTPEEKPIENQRTAHHKQQPTPSPDRKPIEQQPIYPDQKPIDKQSVSPDRKVTEQQPIPPIPAPRRSKTNSAFSLDQAKKLEQLRSKSQPLQSPIFVSENIIPISSILSNPQSFQQASLSPATISPYKLFPDIKPYEIHRSRNALKSIQRSMDRYRFHVW